MDVFGPWKSIRILDDVLVRFGGHPGLDTKIMIFPLNEDHHYTLSMRHGPDWSSQQSIPIDFHETYVGRDSGHEPMARGSFDLKQIANRLMSEPKPGIQEVDLKAREWRKREVVTIDERLASLAMKKELKVTPDFAELFNPVPVSELQKSEFGIGMLTGRGPPGIFVKADEKAFALTVPGLKGFEERLEEALEFESLTDEDYEG